MLDFFENIWMWLSARFYDFVNFLWSVILYIVEIPSWIIQKMGDLIFWLRDETLFVLKKTIVGAVSAFFDLFGYDVEKPAELLADAYRIADVFFPMDAITAMGIFLLDTYLAVKIFGWVFAVSLHLVQTRKPWDKMTGGGGE